MPLNWDASDLPNMPWADQSEEQRSRTANLAFVCMAVGLRSITESNWQDFYARYRFYCQLHGNLYSYDAIDIYKRIGFWTNCSEETDAKWYKRQTDQFISDRRLVAEQAVVDEEVTV